MTLRIAFEHRRSSADSVLPLINIVFLLLVFFLLAGTIAPRPDIDLEPPTTVDQPPDRLPPDAIYVSVDGTILYDGRAMAATTLADLLAGLPPDTNKQLQIVADRNLEARRLLDVVDAAATAGAGKVRLITLRDGAR